MLNYRSLLLFVLICGIPLLASSQSIDWMSLEEAQEKAPQNDKKIFIYAEAEWCGYCQRMNEEVLPKKSVIDSLEKYFQPVRIDIESKEKEVFHDKKYTQEVLAQKFRVTGTPTMIFLNADGEVLGTQPGFMRADVLDKLLAYVGTDLFNELEFKAYLEQQGVDISK